MGASALPLARPVPALTRFSSLLSLVSPLALTATSIGTHISQLTRQQIRHVLTERDILASTNSPWLVRLLYAFQDPTHVYLAMVSDPYSRLRPTLFHPSFVISLRFFRVLIDGKDSLGRPRPFTHFTHAFTLQQDFIAGGDFRTLLNNSGVLKEEHARFYISEMFCAVNELHKLGYIHRDLKPEVSCPFTDREGWTSEVEVRVRDEREGTLTLFRSPSRYVLSRADLLMDNRTSSSTQQDTSSSPTSASLRAP